MTPSFFLLLTFVYLSCAYRFYILSLAIMPLS